MKKLGVSLVVLVLGISSFLFFSKPNENDELGEVEIIIVNELEEIVYSQTLKFQKEDSLFELLDQNLEVKCANASYQISDNCSNVNLNGKVILGLNELETDWQNSFIAIYVDDIYSEYGIDNIALEDDTEYRFEYQSVGGDNE